MYDAFAVISWSAAGIEPSAISILWSEAVAAEVVVFFLIGPALLHRFGARGAAALAAVAGTVRWSVAGVNDLRIDAFNSSALHGLTFRPASSCLDAHDGRRLFPVGLRNRPIYLRVWLRLLDWVLTLLSGFSTRSWSCRLPFDAFYCAVALPLAWFGFADGGIVRPS